MPWQEVSAMSQRREFVMLAQREEANIRELCRRYGISPTTGYKWLDRGRGPDTSFAERPRVPHHQPGRTAARIEALVLKVRDRHPVWGGRKIRRRLMDLGHGDVPSASTITTILKRNGRIDPAQTAEQGPWQRFVRERPNELWQMDFKGHFAMVKGRCHPLTVIDDCSRFALAVDACSNETKDTVRAKLSAVFRRYGLPVGILSDNGQPWGGWERDRIVYTALAIWLIRLGITLPHGKPGHPQTQGKDERFNRTLKSEVVDRQSFADINHCQHAFDSWRHVYNCERPHDALELEVPAKRYQVSERVFPELLPPIEYADRLVRKVQGKGEISFQGREYFIGTAFAGHPVALRHSAKEDRYDVYYCHQQIASIDLRDPS